MNEIRFFVHAFKPCFNQEPRYPARLFILLSSRLFLHNSIQVLFYSNFKKYTALRHWGISRQERVAKSIGRETLRSGDKAQLMLDDI